MSKPVIFLVHGAWFASFAFEPLVQQLKSQGYETWAKDLPSATSDPSKGTDADIAFIREELEALIGQEKDVVMCGWSMGAWSGPAAIEGLVKKSGQGGGVVGLVYMSCVIPSRQGMTAMETMGEYRGANNAWYDPRLLEQCDMEYGPLMKIGNPAPIFYTGLPASVDQAALTKQVVPVAGAAFGVYPYVPRNDKGGFVLPTMFISTRDDLSVPTRVQDEVIAKEGKRFAKVEKIAGGHLVGMCQPEKVANAIASFAGGL